MHQHTIAVTDEVCMEVLNLKVINLDGSFKYLVLDLFNYNVFTVKRYKYISGAKLTSSYPALYRGIKWMLICANYFFSISEYV